MGTSTKIADIRTVAVPVDDIDRAIGFYAGTLGFEVRYDEVIGPDMRWVELAPPGATTSVALVRSGEELPAGVDTGVRFVTDDAAADHAHLTAQGIDAGELLRWEGVPPMFHFRDPDGNSLYVVERDDG